MTKRLITMAFASILVFGLSMSMWAADTSLTWLMYGGTANTKIYERVAQEFEEKNPGIKIELLPLISSAQYMEKLITMFVSGNPPDVFLTFAQHRDQWIERGILYDLTSHFQKSDLVHIDMYYPPVREVIEVDGKIWGTPWGYNSRVWIINTDLREQRGLGPPGLEWHVDDFQDYARKMTSEQDGVVGASMNLSIQPGPPHLGWMYNFTGEYWVDDAMQETYVDSFGSVEILEFWKELRDFYGAAYGYGSGLSPQGGTRGGRVGMFETWTTEPRYIQDVFEWEFATYPSGPVDNKHFAQGHLWTIAADHPQPEIAWKFVEFLGSMDAERLWAELQLTPPQVYDMDLWDIYFEELPLNTRREAIQFILNDLYGGGRAKNFTYWSVYDDILPIMQDALNGAMQNQESPQAALSNAAQRIRSILMTR